MSVAVNTVPFPTQMLPQDEGAYDSGSVRSDATVSSVTVETPVDSPYTSVVDVIESGEPDDADDEAVEGDEFCTPRPNQNAFAAPPGEMEEADVMDPGTLVIASPSSGRSPLSRFVLKTKGLVKAIVQKKQGRKGPDGQIVDSPSGFSLSSAIPGGWRNTLRRRHNVEACELSRDYSRANHRHPRVLPPQPSRSSSASSTTGVYSPDYPASPHPSFASWLGDVDPDEYARAEAEEEDDGEFEVEYEGGIPKVNREMAEFYNDRFSQQVIYDPAVYEMPSYSAATTPLRILFFVPWCLLLGVTMVVLPFPAIIDRLAFAPIGYFACPPPRGLKRFAFFDAHAGDFTSIAGLSAGILAMQMTNWGGALLGVLMMCLAWSWCDFRPGKCEKCCAACGLGADDRETLWILLSKCEWEIAELMEKRAGLGQFDLPLVYCSRMEKEPAVPKAEEAEVEAK